MLVSVTIDYAKCEMEVYQNTGMPGIAFLQDGHEFCIEFDNIDDMKDLASHLLVKACEIEGKNNVIPLRGERR